MLWLFLLFFAAFFLVGTKWLVHFLLWAGAFMLFVFVALFLFGIFFTSEVVMVHYDVFNVLHKGKSLGLFKDRKEAYEAFMPIRPGMEIWGINASGGTLLERTSQINHKSGSNDDHRVQV